MSLLVDCSLLFAQVLHDAGEGCMDEGAILCRMLSCVTSMIAFLQAHGQQTAVDVVMVMGGPATADVLSRRRRDAHVLSLRDPPTTIGCTPDERSLFPGMGFRDRCRVEFCGMGWEVADDRGCCAASLAALLSRTRTRTQILGVHDTVWIFAPERDTAAVAALCPSPMSLAEVAGDLRSFQPSQSSDPHAADEVVLDILTEGGHGGCRGGRMAQDLPGLPRMPGTYAAAALREAYSIWRSGSGAGRCLTDPDTGGTNRESLAELLALYVEGLGGEDDDRTAHPAWAGPGWRVRHRTHHFPHGCEGACAEYLDAIDRELLHLGGGVVVSHGVYVHGLAPCATDLVGHLQARPASASVSVSVSVPARPVVEWDASMQLACVLPRARACARAQAQPLHTDLHLGCVHMFPISFQVWWDRYPLIPALDLPVLEAAYNRLRIHAGA